ncbi:MAG: hypothetical protein MN733_24590 [Nitrososphaera sp.]|nr:hypothetical protein [Nitrososphaera sp.]
MVMTYRTRLLFALIHWCLVVLLVSACTATPISDPESLAQATPEVNIQGDTPGKEEVQTIELDNCGGKADATRVEQRTQSVDVTISTEVAGKIGASVEVVSAEVQAAVGLAITPGSERSTSIQLVAPPDTRMVFELVWVGNEQIGVVQNIRNSDVPVAFRSFLPTDVRIRSQSDIGCSGSSTPQPVFEPTATPSVTQPYSTLPSQTIPAFNICDGVSAYPGFFQAEDRIPPSGISTMEIVVRAGEIHAITAGTISVAGISLYGGQDRGSVVVLLPSATYNVTDLNPTFNWHGVFHLEPNEWQSLADVLAAQQMIPGTCSDGDGCSIVDVLVVGPNGKVSQYEKGSPLNVNCSP